MKRFILTVIAAVCASGCVVTQDIDTPVSHSLETESKTGARYYRYIPSNYDPGKSWPLVISLHGTWPWDVDWHQILEWKMLGEERGFLVVAPKLGGWSTQGILPKPSGVFRSELEDDETAILAVREEMCRLYNIDRKKILLTGFSSGGYPLYWTGLRNPNKFSALAARSCNCDSRIFEWMDPGKIGRKIPVIILVGKDEMAIQDDAWRTFGWLRKNGWDSDNCIRDEVRGGHLRRPDLAYDQWRRFVLARQRRP